MTGQLKVETGFVSLPEGACGPFLRVPPFPGCKVDSFLTAPAIDRADADDLVDVIRRMRVGGTYWAARPALPDRYVLLRSTGADLDDGSSKVVWTSRPVAAPRGSVMVTGDCDPWHMLAGATALFAETPDEVTLIATILGVPVHLKDPFSNAFEETTLDVASSLATVLGNTGFVNPFTGDPMSARETIELCGFWRALIDSNRDISGALGFAFWKRDNVAPLLWGGSPVRFADDADGSAGPVAIWRSKASEDVVAKLERSGTKLIEVEDGFLRSQGLGADCVPPLSITVDRLGAYFDPAQPSELESLLQDGLFTDELLERAQALRFAIVGAGLGKYEVGGAPLDRPAGSKCHILVPGQVEDDRSVLTGGCGLASNLELLKRVREQAPDAYILYKPHPDVVAGHRKGSISDKDCLEFADQVVMDQPISSLIEMVDEVHVNTSLAGFEALMRNKPVITHGVPFYAGWGLTRDLGPVPARRSAKRTLDELVAAALLQYPRYLDPLSGLPCPAEVVVRRLVDGIEGQDGVVVTMRRLQGKVMRRLREMVG
ncbi:MAG: capsule biosynthesis protein [Sphingomonas sp.]|nr:capsule biosynthesis protein [Sphingomonas sp.]